MIYSEKRKIAFLTIPKNASETIAQCTHKDFTLVSDKTPLPRDTTQICIIRDPFDRWKSGTIEYFVHPTSRINQFNLRNTIQPIMIPEMRRRLTKWLTHDEPQPWDYHTNFQCEAYKWGKFKNIKFYWYNDTVIQTIQNDFSCFKNLKSFHKKDKYADYKKTLLDFIEKNEHAVMAQLQKMYATDYNFIANLKFVNYNNEI